MEDKDLGPVWEFNIKSIDFDLFIIVNESFVHSLFLNEMFLIYSHPITKQYVR